MNEAIQRANRYLALDPKPDTTLYLLTVPPLLLASLSTHVWQASGQIIFGYTVANLLSLAMVFLAFLLARPLVRSRRGNYLLAIGLFGIFLGTVKSVSTALFAILIGVETDLIQGLIDRVATPLIGLWLSLTFAFSKAALREIDRTRELIRAEEKRQQQAMTPSVPELERFLAKAHELSKSTPENASQLAKLILDLVNQGLRPLSRELIERKRISANDIWGLLSLGAASSYKPALSAGLFAASLTTPLLRGGIANGFMGIGVIFVISWLMLSIANVLKPRLPENPTLQLGFLALSSLLTGLTTVSALNLLGLVNNPVLEIAVFSASWWLGNILVIVGMVRVVLGERKELNRQVGKLMELRSQRGGGEESALHRRELANHLHSHVQNKLLSQALRIETEEDINLEREMEILLETLKASKTPSAETQIDLSALIRRWAGTLQIQARCEFEPTPLVLAAIEEAITNAFRHGKASEVEVLLTKERLEVSDNGLGPIGGSLGLGSLSFGQLGQWSLSSGTNGGAILQINLGVIWEN